MRTIRTGGRPFREGLGAAVLILACWCAVAAPAPRGVRGLSPRRGQAQGANAARFSLGRDGGGLKRPPAPVGGTPRALPGEARLPGERPRRRGLRRPPH